MPVSACNFNTTQHLCFTSPLLRPHNILALARLLIHLNTVFMLPGYKPAICDFGVSGGLGDQVW